MGKKGKKKKKSCLKKTLHSSSVLSSSLPNSHHHCSIINEITTVRDNDLEDEDDHNNISTTTTDCVGGSTWSEPSFVECRRLLYGIIFSIRSSSTAALQNGDNNNMSSDITSGNNIYDVYDLTMLSIPKETITATTMTTALLARVFSIAPFSSSSHFS